MKPSCRLLLIALLAAPTTGQHLADPQRSVFAAFPEADSYQVITRDVDVETRRRIEAMLPFRLHFNELRSHSLYVALRGRQPLGLVYARREEGACGLTDLTWSMSLDLRVIACHLERVRSAQPLASQDAEFTRRLAGRDRSSLVALLDPKGELHAEVRDVADRAFLAMLVRSALKTLAIADTVWPAELQKLRDLALALQAFPPTQRVQRLWPPETGDAGTGSASAETVVAHAVRAFGLNRTAIGIAAEVRCSTKGGEALLRCAMEPSGEVRAFTVVSGRIDPDLHTALAVAVGTPMPELAKRGGPIAPIAQALLATLDTASARKP